MVTMRTVDDDDVSNHHYHSVARFARFARSFMEMPALSSLPHERAKRATGPGRALPPEAHPANRRQLIPRRGTPIRQVKDSREFLSLNRGSRLNTRPQPLSTVPPPPPPIIDDGGRGVLFDMGGSGSARRRVLGGPSPQNTLNGNSKSNQSASTSMFLSQPSKYTEEASAKRKWQSINKVLVGGGNGDRYALKKKRKDELISLSDASHDFSERSSIRRTYKDKDRPRSTIISSASHSHTLAHHSNDFSHGLSHSYGSSQSSSHSSPYTATRPTPHSIQPDYRIKLKSLNIGPFAISGPGIHLKIIDYNKQVSHPRPEMTGVKWEIECPEENYEKFFQPKHFELISKFDEKDIDCIHFGGEGDGMDFLIRRSSQKKLSIPFKGDIMPIKSYYLCMEKVTTGKVNDLIAELKGKRPLVLKSPPEDMMRMKNSLRPGNAFNKNKQGERETKELFDLTGKSKRESSSSMTFPAPAKVITRSSLTTSLAPPAPPAPPPPPPPAIFTKVSKLSLKGDFCYKFPDKKSFDISELDYSSLNDMEFVNDTIINLFLKLSLFESDSESTHLFNTFFYDKLSEKNEYGKTSYEGAMRWTAKAKVDLFTKKFVIMPINEAMHWYVAIIYNLPELLKTAQDDDDDIDDIIEAITSNTIINPDSTRELRNRTINTTSSAVRTRSRTLIEDNTPVIFILDSLRTSQYRNSQASRKIRDFIVAELQERKNIKINKDVIRSKSATVPQQNNYCDCGIYVIHYIEKFLKDPERFVKLMAGTDNNNKRELEQAWDERSIKNKRLHMKLRLLKLESKSKNKPVSENITELEDELEELEKSTATNPTTAANTTSTTTTSTTNTTTTTKAPEALAPPRIPTVNPRSRIMTTPTPSPSPIGTPTIQSPEQVTKDKTDAITSLSTPKPAKTTSPGPSTTSSPLPHPTTPNIEEHNSSNMDVDNDNDDDMIVVSSLEIKNPSATRTSKRLSSRFN